MNGVPCGCCTTPGAAAPADVANRPWLSAIAYRVGTFAKFRKALTDELSRTAELAGLTARLGADYTITAIELWAAVADVLTFYQERLANEAFLRTSTLRDSVLRLVRLIDYQLRPGAAATTQLAFTLEPAATALVPAGTRVQSVPGEGEKPQKFETLAPLAADGRLNRQRVLPLPSPASPLGPGSASAIVAPDAAALATAGILAPGDRVALYAPGVIEILTVSALRPQDELLRVAWEAPVAGTAFQTAFDASDPAVRASRLGRSFRLFGFDAPGVVVVPEEATPGDPTTTFLNQAVTNFTHGGDGSGSTQLSLDARYPGLKPGAAVLAVRSGGGAPKAIPFEVGAVSDVHVERKATTATPTQVTALGGTITRLGLTPLTGLTLADLFSGADDVRNVVVYELLGEPLRFWPYDYADTVATGDVYLPGRRAGWSAVEVGRTVEKGTYRPGTAIDPKNFPVGRAVLLTDEKGGEPVAATVAASSIAGNGVSISATATDAATVRQLGLAPDQGSPATAVVSGRSLGATVTFPNARRELTVRIGPHPPQTIVLDGLPAGPVGLFAVAAALQTAVRAALPGVPTFAQALAWVVGEAIAVAPGVAGDEVSFEPSANDAATAGALGLEGGRTRFLDGLLTAPITIPNGTMVTGALRVGVRLEEPADRPISFFTWSTPVDAVASALRLQLGLETQVAAGSRVLIFPPLPTREPRTYLRLSLETDGLLALDASTAVLLGNVAPASHGESVRNEIVGDGDASQPFQRFTLKKKPVTYVPDAVPGGVASSLTLLVDGVRWTEAPTLYGARPTDRIFVTRIADDKTLTVLFGNGTTGARVTTGRQNVVATYRNGLGVAGRVGAGKLTTLLDRPTGVKSVLNLLPADGGADPETMVRARDVAPGTVRTFGRAVSLRDFEDTALLAGEVAKASATWVWNGERRAIHLTVAAQAGGIFSPAGLERLAATLATERDPNHKLLIDNYQPVAVLVDATLLVDERHVAEKVLAAGRAALLDALSFDRRRFAEPVYLSDVYRILQDVEGVVAVDVNVLDLKSTDAGFRAAHGIDPALGQPQPRLLMLPARPLGSPGAVAPAELAWVEVPAQDVTLRTSGGLSS